MQRFDEEHLAYATQLGRVVYSFNIGDFSRLHAEWLRIGKSHGGIVLAHQWRRYSIGAQLQALVRLSTERSPGDMQNQLEYLSDWM